MRSRTEGRYNMVWKQNKESPPKHKRAERCERGPTGYNDRLTPIYHRPTSILHQTHPPPPPSCVRVCEAVALGLRLKRGKKLPGLSNNYAKQATEGEVP
ncbi:hypothetical protein GJAV_G00138500 [Gymnothorax javanicus]|nr:hypothetical protein GJAV_G00138500 [Gymnothorax javanicus]